MKSRALALAFLLLVSCIEPVERLHLALPELGPARAIIVVAEEANARGFRMFAAAITDKIEIPAGPGVVLRLLTYEASLEELGLETGPLGEPRACRRDCVRLEPTAVFEASGEPEALEWRAAELPQSVKDRLVIAPDDTCGPCRRFDQHPIALPSDGFPRVAVEGENGDVQVAVQTGELFDVHAGGTFDLRCMLPYGPRAGARRASDETLVIALVDGRVVRVTDPSTCAVEELGVVEGEPIKMAVSESDPLIAYVFTNQEGDAMLWRVATSSSAKVHHHLVDPDFVRGYERSFRGDVLWLGPEHVLFVAGDDAIYRLKEGAVRRERLDAQDLVYRAQSLLATPQGTIVGVEPWGVAVDNGGSWRPTYAEPTWYSITSLGRYEDVVLVGEDGTLEIYHPEKREYCPRFSQMVPQHLPQALVRLGAREVIVMDSADLPRAPPLRRLVRQDDLCE